MATISPATQRSASRLQRGRVAAFKEFRADVESGAYPEEKRLAPIADAEFEAFMDGAAEVAADFVASLVSVHKR